MFDPSFLLLALIMVAMFRLWQSRYYEYSCPGCGTRKPDEHSEGCHFGGK